MSDIISSASLILTTITLLYTVWNPSIEKYINLKTDRLYKDLEIDHIKLKKVLNIQSLPLAVFSTMMSLIYLPVVSSNFFGSLQTIFNCYFKEKITCSYDTISAVLIFIEICFIFLTYYLWSIFKKLSTKNLILNHKKAET